jgi:hypothetical protein
VGWGCVFRDPLPMSNNRRLVYKINEGGTENGINPDTVVFR